MRLITSILFLFLGVISTGTTFADVLVINEVVTSDDRPDLPQNGLTKDQVRQSHGEPQIEHPAVGDPPITRWDYPEYSVYFELDRVITAVVKPTPYSSKPTETD